MPAAPHGCSKGDLSLPVVGGAAPRVRPSGSTKWRFLVLFVVQALMILHLLQWLWSRAAGGGDTLSPVEPSESMQFVKEGVINAGTILFGAALLSTVILGRWFCGWGCHVLLLQDGCAWILKKMGLRPRAFRSRLLMWVPLGLALYMFVWPVAYRWAIAPYTRPSLAWPGFSNGLVTENFWATFPGVMMAVPFLLVCGFAVVYFLGQKGYCTYACPYGGFFAPLDRWSPLRIRVNDDCEHCGHCTAVCTSNVRVHEEVAKFGMVVDPGCMKCLDCVSVCPNDALRVGWGVPALQASPRAGAIVGPPGHRHAVPEHAPELSMKEEVAVLVVGVAALLALNAPFVPALAAPLMPPDGIKVSLPLLFASGLAAIAAFLAWKSWRLLGRANEGFHSLVLRRAGRITAAGWAWLALAAAAWTVVGAVGLQNLSLTVAALAERRVTLPGPVFVRNAAMPAPEVLAAVETADRAYEFASLLGRGGIGFVPAVQPYIDLRRASLAAIRRDYKGCELSLRAVWAAVPPDAPMRPDLAAEIARALWAQGALDEMDAWYAEQIAAHPRSAHPEWTRLHRDRVAVAKSDEDLLRQVVAARDWAAWDPDDLEAMRHLSLLLVENGEGETIDEGIRLVHRTLEIEPANPGAWRAIAIGHARLGRHAEAEAALRKAIEIAPDDWRWWQALGEFLRGIGREEDAAAALDQATRRLDAEQRRLAPPPERGGEGGAAPAGAVQPPSALRKSS